MADGDGNLHDLAEADGHASISQFRCELLRYRIRQAWPQYEGEVSFLHHPLPWLELARAKLRKMGFSERPCAVQAVDGSYLTGSRFAKFQFKHGGLCECGACGEIFIAFSSVSCMRSRGGTSYFHKLPR